MKKIFILIVIVITLQANAKVWRVNNTLGIQADFSSINACVSNASVLNGDTVHIEGSATTYAGFDLSKRLVIIGTGYFLSGTNANTGLQANPNSASIGGSYITFDTLASGSVIMGIDNFFMGVGAATGASGADNITITRCRFSGVGLYYGYTANTDMSGWKFNKCYITSAIGGNSLVLKNCEITNNIFTSTFGTDNPNNLNNLIRNNVMRGQVFAYNAYFANNIITPNTFNVTNVTVKNNTCIGGSSTGFSPFVGTNGNVAGSAYTDANIFQGISGNSEDGQWRLIAGSQAIGTGETVSSITPDRGAFGTADPYVLSGIPPIPTIYLLTVPAAVASTATTMPITISTKSNN